MTTAAPVGLLIATGAPLVSNPILWSTLALELAGRNAPLTRVNPVATQKRNVWIATMYVESSCEAHPDVKLEG